MVSIEDIKRRLWDGANELRGSMDASRYKDYMLGLMFYKFLSDRTLEIFKYNAGLEGVSERELVEAYKDAKEKYGEQIEKMIQGILDYYVSPEYLYQSWIMDIEEGKFELQKVTDSLNHFERTIAVSEGTSDFKGLFANSNMDLTDTALGSSLNDRSNNIKALILLFADLDMVALQKNDVLGDAYEYLIGQFAMESGKKAGEFYTPRQVSEILAQTVAQKKEITSIYDPCVGSGSLLLTVKKHLSADKQRELEYYGQEKNTATYNLTRMNLLLHGVKPDKMTIKNGDTLAADWPEDPQNPDKAVQFDAVVMNPPYSLSKWNKAGLRVSDPRFEAYGCLPPDSKGDYAFLLHGLYHLETNGVMSIVLPHGVLFRGGTEGEIRKKLIDKNRIDTIIGLPNNLFTNTGIPVIVMVLKKNRKNDEPVLIIDASNNYIKVGKQNVLEEKDIAKIIHTYSERNVVEGYSYAATREDIIKNDYNLNIPRYVEGISQDIPHDVEAHLYGGIPQENIADLVALNSLSKATLDKHTKIIRPGYVEINADLESVEREILLSDKVVSVVKSVKNMANAFADKYMSLICNLDEIENIGKLKNGMYSEMLNILKEYEFIDEYDGYQIVADIWNKALNHDTEMIVSADFYTVARMREPRMITKGSGKNKREEQDGWNGVIVSNDIVKKLLYGDIVLAIDEEKRRFQMIEDELVQLAESAMEEDTIENDVLFEMLKKNDDGDAQPIFESKYIKAELRLCDKQGKIYEVLKKVDLLMTEKTSLVKKIREDEMELIKAVEERIEILTEAEIDKLMYEKWFGTFVEDIAELAKNKLKNELDILKMLHNRYSQTLESIDSEIEDLMKSFSRMQQELVVI
ncbi:MAG: type I restriction-modification system subunit M [Lachnospiraceae bacterium]|nr:type I restriction-modification system subunit M [Lachnospiraceae bacterium]